MMRSTPSSSRSAPEINAGKGRLASALPLPLPARGGQADLRGRPPRQDQGLLGAMARPASGPEAWAEHLPSSAQSGAELLAGLFHCYKLYNPRTTRPPAESPTSPATCRSDLPPDRCAPSGMSGTEIRSAIAHSSIASKHSAWHYILLCKRLSTCLKPPISHATGLAPEWFIVATRFATELWASSSVASDMKKKNWK